MKSLRCWWWMGCMGVALLGAPTAHAADGRITFSGAILAPTCAVTPEDAMAAVAGKGVGQFRNCVVSGQAAVNASGSYTLSVSQLTRMTMDERLRRYFADFLAVQDVPAQARLVNQTYQ